jgi:hypothetical protein
MVVLPSLSRHGVFGLVVAALGSIYILSSLMSHQSPAALPYVKRVCPRATVGGPDVVVYIPSPVHWRERRQRVMHKMRPELDGSHVWFIIGTLDGPTLDRPVPGLGAVRREAAEETSPLVRYLFVPCRDYGDEFDNSNGTSSTTCKAYQALKFIAHTYAASPPRFVWRGAVDSYLDLRVFRTLVAPALQACRLFLGEVRNDVAASDLWLSRQPRLQALYGLYSFGKYITGVGFCMSWDVVQFIGNAPIPPRQTWCEDVMVGHWLLFYDVDFVDVRAVRPDVGILDGWELATDYVLVGHKLTQGQWAALERRPKGSMSSAFMWNIL